jgi:hypothetical protein
MTTERGKPLPVRKHQEQHQYVETSWRKEAERRRMHKKTEKFYARSSHRVKNVT